jgi:hypothetical protein
MLSLVWLVLGLSVLGRPRQTNLTLDNRYALFGLGNPLHVLAVYMPRGMSSIPIETRPFHPARAKFEIISETVAFSQVRVLLPPEEWAIANS